MVPAGLAETGAFHICSQAPRMHLEDGASLGQLPVGVGVHEGVAMADAAGLRTTSMRLLVVEIVWGESAWWANSASVTCQVDSPPPPHTPHMAGGDI